MPRRRKLCFRVRSHTASLFLFLTDMFYQPFKHKTSFMLKSLVKPVIITAFPRCIRLHPLVLFYFIGSFFPLPFLGIRQPPAFPCRLQHSTIGRLGLNHRVRDGNGCVPEAHRHRKNLSSDVLLPCVSRTTFLTNLNLCFCSVSLSVHALITKQ